MQKIGIIAGNGDFPVEFAKAAKQKGLKVFAAAHEGETLPELAQWCDAICWVKVGHLGKIIKFFKDQDVHDVLMAGGIKKTRLFSGSLPDLRGAGESGPAQVHELERYAQDVVAVLDAERIDSAVLVGHSMGGQIAQLVARVDATGKKVLILTDGAKPSVYLSARNIQGVEVRPRARPGRGAALRSDMRQLLEELRAAIPAAFESDEYRAHREQLDAEYNERQETAFAELAGLATNVANENAGSEESEETLATGINASEIEPSVRLESVASIAPT